jgi:hypothetical protein
MTRAIASLFCAAGWLLIASWFVALSASPALADPATGQAAPPERNAAAFVGLQSPEQRSTRFSAYSVPANTWSIDAGALGVNGDELYGRLGVSYGLGGGVQLAANLLHWSVGLFGLDARWTFLDTRYFALAASVGVLFGHGDWMWFLAPTAKKLVSGSNMFAVPIGLTASAPLTRWLQVDLRMEYQYTEYFGELGNGSSFYATSQIGARQFVLRPTLRFFLSDATAFEFGATLPIYTQIPVEAEATLAAGNQTRSGSRYAEANFNAGWNIEGGVRSRLQPWLYATVRMHYGRVAKALYGAPLYPSFSLEFRL